MTLFDFLDQATLWQWSAFLLLVFIARNGTPFFVRTSTYKNEGWQTVNWNNAREESDK